MKGKIIGSRNGHEFVTDTEIIKSDVDVKKIINKDSLAVLNLLSKKNASIKDISKELKIPAKTVVGILDYLQENNIIKLDNKKQKFEIDTNGLSLIINDSKVRVIAKAEEISEGTKKFYENFLRDGKFNGYICVGSPDPHGEYNAIARDGHLATYLGLFLGRFIDNPMTSTIVLDTNVISRNLFKNNLILVGGPVTNLVTRDINNFLPIRFIKEEGWALKNEDKFYSRDYEGLLAKIKNPYDKSKSIIVMSGIRNIGTLAAILAATKFSYSTFKSYNGDLPWYTIVRGYDVDGDGEVDSVETIG